MPEQIGDRLRARITTADEDVYRSILAKLEAFAATTYDDTEEDARRALFDLIKVAEETKAVDDAGGGGSGVEDELSGVQRTPSSSTLLNVPAQALQQILLEYRPPNVPVSTEQVAQVLADILDHLAYRRLRDNASTQKTLRGVLRAECRRIGVLPTKRAEAAQFVDFLVGYVNIWLL